ncbi:MAG: glutamate-5-semialdehyde dehydrogenase [Puniceicoccaceae bacterium]|nr:MAG: glutamate-5-semialdehyde dehydrogenase [Puniceicoccaceae bacterium]
MATTASVDSDFIHRLAREARKAALRLAVATTAERNAVLEVLAGLLASESSSILEANHRDLEAGRSAGLSEPLLERLTLTPERLHRIGAGVKEVAALPDPLGAELHSHTRPDGLEIRKVRVPIGVIAIIYESRPNVTIDCAALCLKAGNAAILRGGKEAFHTNTALAALVSKALAENNLPETAAQLVPTTDREALHHLLKLDDLIDCVIPRGGEGLIRMVAETSTIPVIKHYKGICCLYLDHAADPEMAEAIVVNAKTQRPSVCNAAEQLLVHRGAAAALLPRIGRALATAGVELRADEEAAAILTQAGVPCRPAAPDDFRTEFLDLVLAVRLVGSLTEGIQAINTDGSHHSDAIVTSDEAAARTFLAGVDSAAVYWNASTRFTDGYEFGMGAEIGISTDKLHARGPMGLPELCSYKYHVLGHGQIRT